MCKCWQERKGGGLRWILLPMFLFVIRLYSTVRVYSLWLVLGRIWGRCLSTMLGCREAAVCAWQSSKLPLTSAESLLLQGLKLACLHTQHCSYQHQHRNRHLQASSLNGHKCDYITCSFQQQSAPWIWRTHWLGHHLWVSFNRWSVRLLRHRN